MKMIDRIDVVESMRDGMRDVKSFNGGEYIDARHMLHAMRRMEETINKLADRLNETIDEVNYQRDLRIKVEERYRAIDPERFAKLYPLGVNKPL